MSYPEKISSSSLSFILDCLTTDSSSVVSAEDLEELAFRLWELQGYLLNKVLGEEQLGFPPEVLFMLEKIVTEIHKREERPIVSESYTEFDPIILSCQLSYLRYLMSLKGINPTF